MNRTRQELINDSYKSSGFSFCTNQHDIPAKATKNRLFLILILIYCLPLAN